MKRALYFGAESPSRLGHFLHGGASRHRTEPGFPWDVGLLDSGLLNNRRVPDNPDGRVHWTCGGAPLWFAFFWWDRSGDKRPNSNSGFYVQGFGHTEPDAAFEYAKEQWPEIVARQTFPLVLVGLDGTEEKRRGGGG